MAANSLLKLVILYLIQLQLELGLHKVQSNDFKLVINDLPFNTCYVKYVDDTTVLYISKTVNDNTLQAAADHLAGSLESKQWNDD